MRNKLIWITILLIALTSCDSIRDDGETIENITVTSQPPIDNQPSDNASVESSNDDNERFSYLEQLSVDKQASLAKSIEERSLNYLYDFTPEDIVLVYLYALSFGDPDLIYFITYDGGQLPDQDTFRNDYFQYVSNHGTETAVHYRYYDSIKIDQHTDDENKVSVLVTTGVGNITDSMILGLQKEDNVWKIDIYHMFIHYKEEVDFIGRKE